MYYISHFNFRMLCFSKSQIGKTQANKERLFLLLFSKRLSFCWGIFKASEIQFPAITDKRMLGTKRRDLIKKSSGSVESTKQSEQKENISSAG